MDRIDKFLLIGALAEDAAAAHYMADLARDQGNPAEAKGWEDEATFYYQSWVHLADLWFPDKPDTAVPVTINTPIPPPVYNYIRQVVREMVLDEEKDRGRYEQVVGL